MIFNFLRSQIDYIFFLYGLSFFILAGACFLLAKGEKKGNPWFWLGLFGLVHALNEWLDLIAFIIADSFIFQVIRLIVLIVSFALLIEFSRKSLSGLGVKPIGVWAHILVLSLVYLGWLQSGFHGASIAAHSFLGFGAGLSASIIFFLRSSRSKPEYKPWLLLAGLVFGCYALTKLVTSQPPYFLSATLLNQDVFFRIFSFPIQLLRCILAMLSAFALWMYWYSSRYAIDLNLSLVRRKAHISRVLFSGIGFIILGWIITQGVGEYYKEITNQEFIAKVDTAAAAVNPRRLVTLSASADDLNNPDYLRLKEQLKEIKKANIDLRFVYLMRLQGDKILILADSDPQDSPDYSPPGQVYSEAPGGLKEDFFKPEAFILGPYTDRWGSWVSVYGPIIDFETKNVISRIGMDISISVLQDKLYHHRVIGILIAFGLFILLVSTFIIVELNRAAVDKVSYAQKRLQVLIDNIPTPVYYKNKEGVYLGSNIAVEQFLGLSKDQIVGRTVFDIFSDKTIAQKYREMDEALFKQPGVQVYESKLCHADGTDHDVIFNRSTYPGPDGKVAGLVGVIIDITERKRTEASLRRLAAIVESSDDAIIGKDINGTITSWNYGAQKIYGYSAGEAIGRSISLIVPPELENETVFIFNKIKDGEHIEHYETVRITKEGKRLSMSLTISPLKDDSGRIIGASTIARDITGRKAMENELKRKTEFLEAQNEASLDGLLVVDENGKKILTNKRLIELWQIPQHIVDDESDEALLQYVLSRVKEPQQFLDKVNYLYAHREETSKDEVEFRDGTVFDRYSSPIIDKDGKYFGRIWTFRDITERVKAETRIKKLNRMQNALLNPGEMGEKLKIITDGVVDIFGADFCRIWLMGPGDRCNSTCLHAAIKEGPHMCVKRDKCLHLVSSSGRYMHIDGGVHARVPFGSYKIGGIASGEYPSFLTNDVVHDPRVHNHEWAAELGLVSFAGFRLGLSGGETIGVLALFSKQVISSEEYALLEIISNITIRVVKASQAEEQIEMAVKEWERTFNSISDLIFIQDKNFNVVKVNRSCSEALKLKPEEIIGKRCYEMFHGLDHPWPSCPTVKAQEDLAPHTEEVDDPRIGVPLLVTVSPIFNAKGEFIGSVHVARDISERKKVENALREVINMKTDFTSMVSHELRTPLAAIKEGISIVLDGTSGAISKDQKEFLDIAKRNVDRLARLINDILDFQKLESGKMVFNMQVNDINEVAKEVEKIMRGVIEKKGLSLKFEFDSKLPKIQFDRDRIIQVFINLLNNAVKFTEKGGIKIRTGKAGNFITVSVKDTGIGIKESDIPLLFERFRQLDSGMTRKTGSTGLGLSICKDIIEKHGGKIWVESQPGEGSIFNFSLPLS